MKFFISIIVLGYVYHFCICLRLNPLENNDKLQSISNLYIAEWQWESWPVKQDVGERDAASPGPRMNAALWKDSNGLHWYLFGGQPIDTASKKVYSDIWKYSVPLRVWERVFPSQDYKGKYIGKIGGMMTLRANVFDGESAKKFPNKNENQVILCGRSSKKNSTLTKKSNWSNFSRKKKEESKTMQDESKSLAVYGPRTSKSNTVWQMDLKDKLWTAYVCCCDTSHNENIDPSGNNSKSDSSANSSTTIPPATIGFKESKTDINLKIDKIEDEMDNEHEQMMVKTKKKKINQMKKKGDFVHNERKREKKREEIRLQNNGKLSEKNQNEDSNFNYSKKDSTFDIYKNLSTEVAFLSDNQSLTGGAALENNEIAINHKTLFTEKTPVSSRSGNKVNSTGNIKISSKLVSKYCPDFTDEGEPVSWCDGNNDALITADISSSKIILWVLNLKTSHWSQQSVSVADNTQWPGCSNLTPIRYAGIGAEVYIVCAALKNESDISGTSASLPGKNSNFSSQVDESVKLVYRISSRRLIIESLGKIKLDKFSKLPDYKEMWKNESRTILKVIRISDAETILLLAYNDFVDLWILTKKHSNGYQFEPIENIWRGSASKWFNKYNAATYNFQFISESNSEDTLLTLNPRSIPPNEYWPRERGRFIIRILKNENLKNQSFENQTREHNSTYDLLQSDYKLPINESFLSHSYNIKVLMFFGISLTFFTVFGVFIFLKKCVNCPSRILLHTECRKSPPVIRYSVIPEDLLYPVA